MVWTLVVRFAFGRSAIGLPVWSEPVCFRLVSLLYSVLTAYLVCCVMEKARTRITVHAATGRIGRVTSVNHSLITSARRASAYTCIPGGKPKKIVTARKYLSLFLLARSKLRPNNDPRPRPRGRAAWRMPVASGVDPDIRQAHH